MPFDFNQQIIDEFRAGHGHVEMFDGARLILLTTTGARTGKRHTVPVGFLHDPRGRLIVIASAAGAPHHPAWYHNLRANPRVTIETGVFTIEADADVLDGEERDRVFARAVEADPGWAEYQAKTERIIPVVALTPVSGAFPDLPEGDALKVLHDAFRRELALVRREIAGSGPGLGAQLRINCLTLCGGLHHHHGAESGELLPYLRDRHLELEPVLDRLAGEHEKLAGLLDQLQEWVSADEVEPAALLPEVDRIIAEIETHLAYEETHLIPVLNATSREDDRLTVTRIPGPADGAMAVLERAGALASDPPALPPDADRTPAFPYAGGVPGRWVTAGRRPEPGDGLLLYVHGGGFEHANPEIETPMAYRLSAASGRPVFAVEQRLAPAHPYPAPMDDVVAAYTGLLERGLSADRIVLFGESSGGTLVLSALLALRDAGAALPASAIAVSPVTDLTLSGPSFAANDGADLIGRAVLEHAGGQYLAGAPADRAPQSPLHGDLHGLPPLLLAAGSKEILLDDARRFAVAAASAGVRVALDVYEDMPHGFHVGALAGDPLPVADEFFRRLGDWLNGRDGRN